MQYKISIILIVLLAASFIAAADVNMALIRTDPTLISSDGGQTLTFIGVGFELLPEQYFMCLRNDTTTYFLQNQQWVNGNTLTATTVAIPDGTYDAIIKRNAMDKDPIAEVLDALEAAPPPDIIRVVPATVSTEGTTEIEIHGRHLRPETIVEVGKDLLVNQTWVSNKTITGIAPAHGEGAESVALRDPRGDFIAYDALTYETPPAPQVTSVTPNVVAAEGDTKVTVRGLHFREDTVITFQKRDLVSPHFHSETLISGFAPPLSEEDEVGPKNVYAEDDRGRTVLENGVTYQYTPATVRYINPYEVSAGGGTPVEVHGNHFRADTIISFGDHALLNQKRQDDTLITGEAPPLAPGEPAGLKSIFVEDSVGRTERPNGVRYIMPPLQFAPPQQIESSLAMGTAQFTWHNPEQYAMIYVMDPEGIVLDTLPGDATFFELSTVERTVPIALQGVMADDQLTDIVRGIAASRGCLQPPPSTNSVIDDRIEMALYGGHAPFTGNKSKGLGDLCPPSPQIGAIGRIIPDFYHLFSNANQLTSGFELAEPATKLEISCRYMKIAGAHELKFCALIRQVHPDTDFAFEVTFPDSRLEHEKRWHKKVYVAPEGEAVPAGEYLVDIYAVNGDDQVPYYMVADAAIEEPLMFPGAPCPPYPMIKVRDVSGYRTLPELRGVTVTNVGEETLLSRSIPVELTLDGTWYDDEENPHELDTGAPTPHFEYTWTIYNKFPPTVINSGNAPRINAVVPTWMCYSVDVTVTDTECGNSDEPFTDEFAVLPDEEAIAPAAAFIEFQYVAPDWEPNHGIVGLSPPPGEGIFNGRRRMETQFLAVPTAGGAAATEPQLNIRLCVAGPDPQNPQQILAYKIDPVLDLVDGCESTFSGPKYFKVILDDVHALPLIQNQPAYDIFTHCESSRESTLTIRTGMS